LPDDTWILRPQDLPAGFHPLDDVWYFSRVAGTFRERQRFHGCQMPEQLLARIVRVSSCGEEAATSGRRPMAAEAAAGAGGAQKRDKSAEDASGGRAVAEDRPRAHVVLDPFAGSGTTLAVAKKLGRRYLGFELSASYADAARQRLQTIATGDPIDGPADPVSSSPATADGVTLEDRQRRTRGRKLRPKRAASPPGPSLFE
jgi:site-specific DNA-methyltransferase (adenine-specific)